MINHKTDKNKLSSKLKQTNMTKPRSFDSSTTAKNPLSEETILAKYKKDDNSNSTNKSDNKNIDKSIDKNEIPTLVVKSIKNVKEVKRLKKIAKRLLKELEIDGSKDLDKIAEDDDGCYLY